jgi:hypothetical protein
MWESVGATTASSARVRPRPGANLAQAKARQAAWPNSGRLVGQIQPAGQFGISILFQIILNSRN